MREHRLEVVLDRGLAGHVGARLARERAPHRRRVALRVLEVERRVDLAVEERRRRRAASPACAPGTSARRRRGALRAAGRRARADDDREDPVGPLAEVALEELAGAVGLGARDGERVREVRRQRDAARTPTTSTASQASSTAHGSGGRRVSSARARRESNPQAGSVASAVRRWPRGHDTRGMRKLLILLVPAPPSRCPDGGRVADGAARADPRVRGLPRVGARRTGPLGASHTVVLKPGGKIEIRVNCPMAST